MLVIQKNTLPCNSGNYLSFHTSSIHGKLFRKRIKHGSNGSEEYGWNSYYKMGDILETKLNEKVGKKPT